MAVETAALQGNHSRQPGPPSQLTRRKVEAIASMVRAGLSPTRAANMLGISDATFSRWRQHGRDGADYTPNRQLYRDLDDAIADAEHTRNRQMDALIERARRHASGAPVR